MIDGTVIKADLNPWRKMGCEVQTVLTASCSTRMTPRRSATGCPTSCATASCRVAAATRMALDNASVVCGPNLELSDEPAASRIRT
jgi:hypothetical protein